MKWFLFAVKININHFLASELVLFLKIAQAFAAILVVISEKSAILAGNIFPIKLSIP
jgi:hypothetical protein